MDSQRCPACGEENPGDARLCGMCGSPLRADEAAGEVRREVTIVTSDLKGSTALGEQLDPEALREVLNRYFAVMRAVFESHGGTIEKIIGDAIVAVFGLPFRHEDDPLRGVEAAAESQRSLATLNDELERGWGVRLTVRTGVATGDVTFGKAEGGQHVLLGGPVEIGTVMEQNAPAYEVLVHESTARLVTEHVEVEDFGLVSPKGSDETFQAYRLVAVRERATQDDAVVPEVMPGMRICPGCGEQNPERMRLCTVCGASLSEVVAQESRRTVTIVFAMPKIHSLHGEAVEAEALRDVMSRYFDAMRDALEHHGGTVEKFIGDAVMAVFGLPVRHEDDAVRAIRAAADMQAALDRLNRAFRAEFSLELSNHIGVNSGEVIAGDASTAQRMVTGDAVNTAARLEQAAGSGDIVLGDLTYRLARDQIEVEFMEPLALKGKAEPVPAYRFVGVKAQAAADRSHGTPFVGREAELARLAAGLGEATSSRAARLLAVVGDAGVGKSRLIREFAAAAEEQANIVRGRCLPYGDGITFWPLAEVVREAAGITNEDSPRVAARRIDRLLERAAVEDRDAVVARVAAAINLSDAQFSMGELMWGGRRLLHALAADRPLVMLVDDIHWAEGAFLEFLDYVVGGTDASPILILGSSRHEIAERHPEWVDAHRDVLITLEPLSETAAGEIVEQLLGSLEEDVRARIARAAEGNPLYVEQIVSMLVETGAIERGPDGWIARAGAGQLQIPPTVQALVASRLDALRADERGVVDPASVIGLTFALDAISELVAESIREGLEGDLRTLVSKQLVRRLDDEEVLYRFGHQIIRDTAYGSLLKRVRATIHERFVTWAERVNRERGRELEFQEILGYHLEQAYRYRTELGVVGEADRDVGRRASVFLSAAGRRAHGRGDAAAAAGLLRRAADVLPEGSRERLELLPEYAEASIEQGAFEAAGSAVEEAASGGESIGDARLRARAALVGYQLAFSVSGSVGDDVDAALRDIRRTMADFEEAGDSAGLARAWRLLSVIDGTAGRYDRAAEAARHVVEAAERAGDSRLAARGAISYAYATLHGTTAVAESLAICEEFVQYIKTDRQAEAIVLGVMAQLHAMEGRFERARTLIRESQELVADLAASITAASMVLESSRVEMLAGDAPAAEAELRRGYGILEAMGETYFRSTVAAMLGQAIWAQGRRDEALAYARTAREIADTDDVLSQVGWRMVEAKALAEDDPGAAVALAREAVDLAGATVDIELHADALVELDEVLGQAGRMEEQGPGLRRALELYERKGDLVTAATVRDRLAGRVAAEAV